MNEREEEPRRKGHREKKGVKNKVKMIYEHLQEKEECPWAGFWYL